jgi:predicted DNA-binding protein
MDEQPNFNSSISTRCTNELRETYERLAAKDQRPLANYVRLVLEKHAREEAGKLPEKQKRRVA